MLFEPVESKWHVTSALQQHWPRTDFLDQARQEAKGISPIGAAGDFALGQESSKLATSNGQLQRLVRQLMGGGTNRIQGIKVARTQPTNGQVLTYDAATGYYVPATPASPTTVSAASSMGGSQYGQTYNLTAAEPLIICPIGGNSLVAVTGLEKLDVIAPFPGTLKNLYSTLVASNGPTTYTLTVLVNHTATALAATGTTSGSLSLNDLTHTVTVAAGDLIELRLSVAPAETGTIQDISFGLEYDKT
jgi:hypothetical protein